MRAKIIIVALCFSPCLALAQRSPVDSIQTLLLRAKQDTSRVRLFNEIARALYRRNPQQSRLYADSALFLAERLQDKRGIAGAARIIGLLHYTQGKYGEALGQYDKAKRLFEELGDKQGIAGILNNMGALTRRQGNLNGAMELYRNALKIYESLDSRGDLGDVLSNIGSLYRAMNNYPEALANFVRALRLFEQVGDNGGVASVTMNAGNVYFEQRQYNEAQAQYEYALRAFEAMGDTRGVANCLLNIGRVAHRRENNRQAEDYYVRALKLYEELKDKSSMAMCLSNLAVTFGQQNDYARSEEYFRRAVKLNAEIGNELELIRNKVGLAQALAGRRRFDEADSLLRLALASAQERKSKNNIQLCYETLSAIADSAGRYQQSLQYFKIAKQWNDSIFNEESAKNIAQFRTQYETEKKERQIVLLEKEKTLLEISKSLQSAELERQRLRQIENEQRIALLDGENKLRESEIERERLDIERKNKEIALVRKEREAQDLELRKRTAELRAETATRTLLLGSIGAMALLGFVLANRYRLKQRSENALLAANRRLADANEEISRQMDIQTEQAREIELANTRLLEQNQVIELKRVELERANALLDNAHQKSEALLLNILPAQIAHRLKSGERAIADKFDSVTVLFADIAGFTNLSTRATPEDLVQGLNAIFERFDILARKYGLEKIKTIGDAYMVAGGLPEPSEDHCRRVALFALEIQSALDDDYLLARGGERVQLRIGIHSGEAVAGVIGTSKFAYDLWGDTVNTASRMESHGEPSKIHCSDATYQILKEEFLFERRGEIEVKGKGAMRTWFLVGVKSEFSASE